MAGHTGLVGSALVRKLEAEGHSGLILRTHAELDLTCQPEVETFFSAQRPTHVFLAAARVGGIWANSTYPAEFIYDNLAIQTNVIHAAWKYGVRRLLFLGSSCIYPRQAPQPMKEEYLLTGPLEPTNEPYALAKIAGIVMCRSYNIQYGTQFFSVMPTNLYGPNDNFDLNTSHVLPALLRKFHLAKLAAEGNWESIRTDEEVFGTIPREFMEDLKAISWSRGHKPPRGRTVDGHRAAVTLWGTGKARREFMHVDDMADACVFLMGLSDEETQELFQPPNPCFLNIGVGSDCTVEELAKMVAEVVGCDVPIRFDGSRPDGTPRKLLDVSRMERLGWRPSIGLRDGIASTYRWYCAHGKGTE